MILMEPANSNGNLSTMRRNIAAFTAILLAGAILGVAPFAFYIKGFKSVGSELFFVVYISVVIVITFIGIFREKISPTATPRIGEYGIAALGILCFHAIAGLVGFVSYLGLLWGIKLGRLAASRIGWDVSSNPPYSIAFWPSAILTLLLGGIYAFTSVNSVSRTLFSAKAGVRSTHYMTLRGRRRLDIHMFYYPIGALIICGVIAYAFKFHPTALLLAFQLLLFFVGLLPMQLLQSSRGSPIKREAVLAITKLAQALGYNVIDSPRTKDLGVDPMLEGTELLLSKGQQAWLLDIKTSLWTAEPVQSWDVSALPLASRALSKFINKDEKAPITVTPVLVLIGRSPSGSLEALAKDDNLRLVRFENMASVLEILKINDEAIIREKATSYFGKDFASADA